MAATMAGKRALMRALQKDIAEVCRRHHLVLIEESEDSSWYLTPDAETDQALSVMLHPPRPKTRCRLAARA